MWAEGGVIMAGALAEESVLGAGQDRVLGRLSHTSQQRMTSVLGKRRPQTIADRARQAASQHPISRVNLVAPSPCLWLKPASCHAHDAAAARHIFSYLVELPRHLIVAGGALAFIISSTTSLKPLPSLHPALLVSMNRPLC